MICGSAATHNGYGSGAESVTGGVHYRAAGPAAAARWVTSAAARPSRAARAPPHTTALPAPRSPAPPRLRTRPSSALI